MLAPDGEFPFVGHAYGAAGDAQAEPPSRTRRGSLAPEASRPVSMALRIAP